MKIIQNTAPVVTMGNVSLPASSAKIMSAYSGTNLYDTLKYLGANYQVPAGKKLRIWASRIQSPSAAGTVGPMIGYGDTAVNNTTAPVNPVVLTMGGGSNYLGISAAANERFEMSHYYEIPAGKYPFINSSAAIYGQFLCEEV